MCTVDYSKKIPILYDVDVFVAGGGPGGCAAAAAAAKKGASVYLAEAQASLGGTGTNGLVSIFMRFGDGVNFLADGIGREVLERMNALRVKPYDDIIAKETIQPETLKRAYDDMLEHYGVKFNLCTSLVDVVSEKRRISYALLSGKSGLYAVRAKTYIDATGDGDLSVLAGATFEHGDENGKTMGSSLCSLWTNIDYSKRTLNDESRLEIAFEDGVFREPDRHLPGMVRISQTNGGGNIGHIFGVDATSMTSVTDALVYGRRLYDDYVKYYNNYLPGFENAELLTTAPMLGIRESRRINCYYRLCRDDYMNRAVFDDEIGRYCYPLDIHECDSSKESNDKFKEEFYNKGYAPGESYGIPYRSIVAKDVDNLLVCGRCICTDRPMEASVRVMPGCFITGQAAGVAATVCIADSVDPKDANIKKIQRELISIGAFLPNYKE